MLVGGIEFGGTKTVVAVGQDDGTVLARDTFPTTSPVELLDRIGAFYAAQPGPIAAIGCGAFGPIVIDPAASHYGHLLGTNKPGWSGIDLVAALDRRCGVPVHLVTDVSAAGIGEARFGQLRGIDLGVYLTVGTGIGGAILHHGKPLPALLHPEMGHLALHRSPADRAASTCQFHANCAEGLAAGPAILARFGQSLSHFPPDGPEIALIADYLGQLCAAIVLMLSPQRIVIGGGVGKTPNLLELAEQAMHRQLGGYVVQSQSAGPLLHRPELGQDAGIIGALCCASAKSAQRRSEPA
ncbi:MAG: hypothetical protein RL339_2045 [Pseudomonadota bacterium]